LYKEKRSKFNKQAKTMVRFKVNKSTFPQRRSGFLGHPLAFLPRPSTPSQDELTLSVCEVAQE
jgi:hypothetical protein